MFNSINEKVQFMKKVLANDSEEISVATLNEIDKQLAKNKGKKDDGGLTIVNTTDKINR